MLKVWGIVENNDLTRPLFIYAQRKTPVPGLTMQSVTAKFLLRLSIIEGARFTCIEEMTEDRNGIAFNNEGEEVGPRECAK